VRTTPLRCFNHVFKSSSGTSHAAQYTNVPETLRQVSNSKHGLALVVIIGGAALVAWILWLSVIRACKRKANIASDATSESAPLLNPDQPPTDLQVSNARLTGTISM
jgi:hypothetical protein